MNYEDNRTLFLEEEMEKIAEAINKEARRRFPHHAGIFVYTDNAEIVSPHNDHLGVILEFRIGIYADGHACCIKAALEEDFTHNTEMPSHETH